jgi:hypothetical protein
MDSIDERWPVSAGSPAELEERVRSATKGTPYCVEPRPGGFAVRVEVESPRWRTLLHRQRVRRVFIHHVAVDERTRTVTLTDEVRTVEWHAGIGSGPSGLPVPHLGASVERTWGRSWHWSFSTTIGDDGPSFAFSSEEGRRLVVDAVRSRGWTVRGRGAAEKIGVIAAVAGLTFAALVLLVVVFVVVLG